MATTTVGLEMEPGFWLAGELLSVRPGRAWTGRDGVERAPWVVAVLLGDSVVKVEYRSEADAKAAVDVNAGGRVALRVYPRAHGDRVYYGGRSVRAGSGEGGEA